MSNDVRLLTLLAATARRDEQAFSRLYELSSANLYGVALRILKKEAAAQDALQDAFVQIWHRAADFHSGKGSPMAWMGSIVRYRALDILRKQKKTVPFEHVELELYEEGSSPAAAVFDSDQARLLWQCLEELGVKQRNTIVMAFIEGLTHDELAKKIATPLGTVKSWIRRGLQSIKGCLER